MAIKGETIMEIKESDKKDLVRCILGSKPYSKEYTLCDTEDLKVTFRDLSVEEDDFISDNVNASYSKDKKVRVENYCRLFTAIVKYKGSNWDDKELVDNLEHKALAVVNKLSTLERDLLIEKYNDFQDFLETLYNQVSDPNS
jgi:hypothetical protein